MRRLFFSLFIIGSMTIAAQEANTNLEKRFVKSVELTSSMEDSWHLLFDVSRWKEWNDYIVDARMKDDFGRNAEGSLVTANSKVVKFKIMDFVEGKSFTIGHNLSSGMLYKKHTIASTDDGSRVLIEVWYKGLSSKNFKKYMGKDYALVLENELGALQRLLQ